MKIKNKILIYFSSTVVLLIALAFSIIYILFSAYREEEFQQLQNKKILQTISLIDKYEKESANISYMLDSQDINDFYDEKLLVFDTNKKMIFASLDSLDIKKAERILNNLSPENTWIETKENDYDLIGTYITHRNQSYYAVSKAYDAFGYTKLTFLRNILILIYTIIVVVMIFVSLYLSHIIAKPIIVLSEKVKKYRLPNETNKRIQLNTSTYELQYLTERFNELLERTNEEFRFQKHTIDHISHQLKTPITVLVSELERIHHSDDLTQIKSELEQQTSKAKDLGSIINVLLQISKIESGQKLDKSEQRIDELTYDCLAELTRINPDFKFDITYQPENADADKLSTFIYPLLVKQAFLNLLTNSMMYSANSEAKIIFDTSKPKTLTWRIINKGHPITASEKKYVFKYFFRGENSHAKMGSGLGLVLTKRIIELNAAKIHYTSKDNNINIFEIDFPLTS